MSWNEPGGDKNDPWSGRGDQKGPPDLDEAIRSLQERLGKIFGGGSDRGREPRSSLKSLGLLILGAILLWLLSGFYIVDEGNHGVVTRFGRYAATTQSGLNWHLPTPIEAVEIVNVRQQRFIEVGYRSSSGMDAERGSVPKEALMLTKDENYVDVRLAVQYQVKNARDFIFNLVNPAATLKQVTESAERGVVGNSNMDFVLTEGRSEIVSLIKSEIQDIMDAYHSGIQVTSVNLQDAQPPEQVQSAFEDAIKAREDKQRLINEAEAYSNDVVPRARGAAARRLQEAEGYKEQAIAQAEGETSRFSKLLGEYAKAPEITRKRLYIESLESVMAATPTVLIDVKAGNNLLYLPLEKMITPSFRAAPDADVSSTSSSRAEASADSAAAAEPESSSIRSSVRGREMRGRQ